MRMRPWPLILFVMAALTFGSSVSWAQDESDFQTWSAVIATGSPSEGHPDVQFWFDGHVRRGDPGTTVIVRPGVGYKLTTWMSVWAGYAWIPVLIDGDDRRIDEQRAWQQVILTRSWLGGALKAQSRTRFEQRFNEQSSDVGLRLREFVRLDYRFGLFSDWGVVAWDELFMGLNTPGFAPNGYDQNRVFAGAMFFATEELRIEGGYLWAHLNRAPTDQNQHALALNFFLSL